MAMRGILATRSYLPIEIFLAEAEQVQTWLGIPSIMTLTAPSPKQFPTRCDAREGEIANELCICL